MYLRRVDNSTEAFGFIFLNPFNSLSIFCSSPCVNNLKVIKVSDLGNLKLNSFLPCSNNFLSISLLSNIDTSILTFSSL